MSNLTQKLSICADFALDSPNGKTYLNEGARAMLREAVSEIERLHQWVYATARSMAESGLTVPEYNAITEDVVANFKVKKNETIIPRS